jgi:hypothetical protein
VNRTESMASSWLEPQIGFQLAHEQFKVPELVELGSPLIKPGLISSPSVIIFSPGRKMRDIRDKPGSR